MGAGYLRTFIQQSQMVDKNKKKHFYFRETWLGKIKTPFGRGVEVSTPPLYQQQPQLPLSDLQGPCWREREAGQAGAWVEGVRG